MKNKISQNFMDASEKFDFETVQRVMIYLDWGWGKSLSVPSIEEMKEFIEKQLFKYLLEKFDGEEDISCSSGGFLVRICKSGIVEIQFILEESYAPM